LDDRKMKMQIPLSNKISNREEETMMIIF
jgi:hypothetical protein